MKTTKMHGINEGRGDLGEGMNAFAQIYQRLDTLEATVSLLLNRKDEQTFDVPKPANPAMPHFPVGARVAYRHKDWREDSIDPCRMWTGRVIPRPWNGKVLGLDGRPLTYVLADKKLSNGDWVRGIYAANLVAACEPRCGCCRD